MSDPIEEAVRAYLDPSRTHVVLWGHFMLTDEKSRARAVEWLTKQVHGVLEIHHGTEAQTETRA